MKNIKFCNRCVMNDKIDNQIKFDSVGNCDYCTSAINNIKNNCYSGADGTEKLNELLTKIKSEMKNQKYDCIMGISGGIDSSYLLYLGYKWKLRVLAIHIDDGFDSEISKENLNKLVKATGFDYHIVKPDAEQYNALTKSYIKAGVANIAVPQDNVLFAFLYEQMKKYKIKYFLSGGNLATESIMENKKVISAYDTANIFDINKKFGSDPIDKLKLINYKKKFIYNKLYGFEQYLPLNFVDYNKNKAFSELSEFCDFKYYGSKHLENILTAFIQLYWMPQKFNIDKRYAHYSSLIVSNQMTRDEAIKLLANPIVDSNLMNEYIAVIQNKLNISADEFEKIMSGPTRLHSEFKTLEDEWIYKIRHKNNKNH